MLPPRPLRGRRRQLIGVPLLARQYVTMSVRVCDAAQVAVPQVFLSRLKEIPLDEWHGGFYRNQRVIDEIRAQVRELTVS